eukprot:TRINITY_DN82968_c0_g1_i1.p1 TRINITY_DN82968_c0_g1~~TRINITY_DN82968_c0_g1_i1.p1  ORF type:complete len:123 (+),score=26.81 TRINITY_DN82968_c0_g1_i1:107-475(+)
MSSRGEEIIRSLLIFHTISFDFYIRTLSKESFEILFSKPIKESPVPGVTVRMNMTLRDRGAKGSVEYVFEGQTYIRSVSFVIRPNGHVDDVSGQLIQDDWIERVAQQKMAVTGSYPSLERDE